MQARSFVPYVLASAVLSLLVAAPARAQCGARPELEDLGFRTGPVQLSSVAPEIAGALSLLVEGGEPNQQGCVMLSPASRPTFYPPFNITFVPDLAGAFVVSYHLDAGGNCLPVYIHSVPATVCNFELFAQSIVCDTRLPAGVAATNALRVRIGSDPTLPVINAPVGFPVELGNRAAFTISATDADGSPLSVTLEPMPLLQHAAYDVASGAFAFTPDESQLGEQVFTAVATGQAGTVRRPIRVLVSARAPGGTTDLAGEVRDSQSAAPVPGIAVRIPGTSLQTTTNQYGRFVLQNIPATAAAVELDGAALNPPYAFVAEDLGLLLGHPLYQGQTNTVWRPVYLPLLGPPAGTIDPTQQSTLTNPAIGVQVVVDAGAATVGGQPFQGAVYLPEVPRNQTPAALPEEYEPALVIAVQPAGINFNPPARVTFPNRSNLPPGTETDLWSIDPVVGQFRIVGTCVVSNDGLRLETTSGGIRNSSWHFAECGGPNSDGKTKDNPCENEELECGKGGHSVVHYQTGNLQEEHRTAPYRSLGQERSLRFVYNSKSAYPNPIVTADHTLHRRYATPQAFSSKLRVGGITLGDEPFFEAPPPQDRSPQRSAHIFDASNFASGYYPVRLQTTSHYAASRVSSFMNDGVMVMNELQSPFGVGWTLDGLEKITRQVDGSLFLVDGKGGGKVFRNQSVAFSLPSFVNLENIQLNGDAAFAIQNPVQAGPYAVVRFTEHAFQTSSLFHTTAMPIGRTATPASFSSSFAFQISDAGSPYADDDGTGADGLAFVLTDRPNAIGMDGENMGYGGLTQSVAVEFDTWWNQAHDPNGNHVGINTGGNIRSVAATPVPQRFNDGQIWYAWVDYDGPTKVLEARVSLFPVRPAMAAVAAMVDIPAVVGVDDIYVGFTSSCGQGWDVHEIRSWTFTLNGEDPDTYLGPEGDVTNIEELPNQTFERHHPDATRKTYDSAGRLTAVIDRNGNTTGYSYDGSGRLQTITDPVGKVTTLTYGGGGLLASLRDPAGRTTTFSHSNGDLVSITDPDGFARQFRYDSRHLLEAQLDKRGTETQYRYDALTARIKETEAAFGTVHAALRRYQASQPWGVLDPATATQQNPAPIVRTAVIATGYTDARGFPSTIRTHSSGLPELVIDPLRRVTVYERDANRRATRITWPFRIDEFQYDEAGNVTEEREAPGFLQRIRSYTYHPTFARVTTFVDADQYTTSYSYDASTGDLLQVTDPLGKHRDFTYFPGGLLRTSKDERNFTTTYAYDASGNLATVTDPLGVVTRYDRFPTGDVQRITEGVGTPVERSRSFTYDAMGRIMSVTDGEGGVTAFVYDENGNLLETRLPTGERVRRTFDELNRLATLVDPLQGATAFTYDTEGNLRTRTNAQQATTSFTYDAAGQLTHVQDAENGVERFFYDPMGNVSLYRNARGRDWTLTYDQFGRRQSLTYPSGRFRGWGYDGRDNLTREFWDLACGCDRRYTYDARSQLIRSDLAQFIGETRSYDDAGNLLRASQFFGGQTGLAPVEFTYDALNRVVFERTLSDGQQPVATIENRYDAVGEVFEVRDTVGSTTSVTQMVHDRAGRLRQVTSPTGAGVMLDYDATGRQTELRYSNGHVGSFGYDPATGRLTGITHGLLAQPPILDLVYETNPNGNISRIQEQSRNLVFGYDRIDRLTSVQGLESYAYDPVGNRTASHLSAMHSHNDDNQLTSDDFATYSYDAYHGNLRTIAPRSGGATRTLYWGFEDELGAGDTVSGGRATYRYDALGRRIEKVVPGLGTRRYVYRGDAIWLEFDGSNQLIARYTHGERVDQPLLMWRGGENYFYHADHLGSVRRLTDSSGGVVNSYDYDSYGQTVPTPWQPQEGVENPFWYTGREEARELELYYYRARYYSPRMGRFVGEDPIQALGSDPHLYRYALCNPVAFIDLDGRDPARLMMRIAKTDFAAGVASYPRAVYRLVRFMARDSGLLGAHEQQRAQLESRILAKIVGTLGQDAQVREFAVRVAERAVSANAEQLAGRVAAGVAVGGTLSYVMTPWGGIPTSAALQLSLAWGDLHYMLEEGLITVEQLEQAIRDELNRRGNQCR